MKVLIPTPLLSYTGRHEVAADGASLAEVMADLDRRYPGIRFRIIDEQDRMRPHIRFFINGELTRKLTEPVGPGDEVTIVQAISGG